MINFIKNIFENIFNVKITYKKNYKEAVLASYDKRIYDIFKTNIKKDNAVIFDVGAHKGESIQRYMDIFNSPIIHCFEPNKDLFKLLNERYKNKNLIFNEIGISDIKGKSKLNVASKTLMSSVENINFSSDFFKKRSITDSGGQTINLDTLDNYTYSNKIEYIDILKLNVQGHEPNCLKGAQKILKASKINFIVVEIDSGDRYSKKNSFFDIEQYLNKNSYSLYDIILIKRDNAGKINMVNAVYKSDKTGN